MERHDGVLSANEDNRDFQVIGEELQQIQGCTLLPIACQQVMNLVNDQHARRNFSKQFATQFLEC
ncbi:hypothetical protein D3C87_1793960 [compost metagenome]